MPEPNGVPPTARRLTTRQQNAHALLRRYLKDAHEHIHGPNSWMVGDDYALQQIVEDMTDVPEITKSVMKRLYMRLRHD